ncbi:hypothetical protein GCM10009639_16470 [Kitasatospora putterlickiae]|uniref:Uncharacterized protein n=1 Tax=Kitasatospora putterlickiae TaxID=221725 RepID=A0ABN1XSJ9_9ACTN
MRPARRNAILTEADLAAIDAAVPAGSGAGERYAAAQMAHLDGERRAAVPPATNARHGRGLPHPHHPPTAANRPAARPPHPGGRTPHP